MQGGYLRIGPPQLKTIPIASSDSADVAGEKRYEQLIVLVDQMLFAKGQLAQVSGQAAEIAARKCTALDRQIDTLVYELYGLTDAEIALVENGG